MEGELKNLIKVWSLAITALSYCYLITSRIPKGLLRLLFLLPIFYLFFTVPLNLSSFHFTAVTSFFLAWLANFKLLLFAFDQGPLSQTNILSHFILVASLPVKIKPTPPTKTKNRTNRSHQIIPPNPNSHKVSNYILPAIKIMLLVILLKVYEYRQYLTNHVTLALYCCHLYLELEIVLAMCATPVRIFGFGLEPQFIEPYLATSLQDFWGRRWNLMVTSILRPTVYNPVQRISSRVIGQKWAPLAGVVATFVVSGLMHEVIYYYFTRVPPTWEVTWFFVLQGVCVTIELLLKKSLANWWQLPPVVSRPLVFAFLTVTGVWLFFPQLLRSNLDDKALGEFSIMVDFIKNITKAVILE